MSRRALLRLISSTAGTVVLAGCGAPAPNSPGTPPPGSTSLTVSQSSTLAPAPAPTAVSGTSSGSSTTPKNGGVLRTSSAVSIANLEPHLLQGWTTSETTWLPYDRLIAYDLQFSAQPMLAESWEVSSDQTQIKFSLRKGVQWHNGRELTSDDVKYTITRARDPKTGSGQFANQAQWFTTIDTPDKYTVVLKSDQPRPAAFDLFESLNVVDSDTLEGPDAKTKVNGTGPFTFVEWAQGDHITYAKNKNYWQSGQPYLDGVHVTFFKDLASMVASLEGGAVDVITVPSRQDFVRLKADPKYQALTHPNSGYWYVVGVNATVQPFDNKLVRQALNFAIDRQRFVDTVLLGVGVAQDLPWSPGSPAYDPAKMNVFPFDLTKAKALLSQAGVSNLTTDLLPLPGLPEASDFAQIYQSDLAQIGITVNIVSMDSAAWLAAVNQKQFHSLYFANSGQANISPATMFSLSRAFDPKNNNSGYQDATYASLVTSAASEKDPTKAAQIYSQLTDIILDQSFSIPMGPQIITKLATANVRDIEPNMHGGWLYTRTWLSA